MSSETMAMATALSKAELREIDRHKYLLSAEQGQDVGFEAAKEDWLEKYAKRWRRERYERMLAMQREEISRHRWIESEKRGQDVGRQAALEWVLAYAANWRDWFEEHY